MDKKVTITYKNSQETIVPLGMTLKELSTHFKDDLKYDILIAKVDNDLAELSDTINRKCNVQFFDRSTTLGRCVYAASANFILVAAVKNVLGEDARIIVHHSLDNGVYCHIENATVTKKTIQQIEEEMWRLVKSDIPFEKISVSRTDAIKYFKSHNHLDKVDVLKYVSNSYVSLYRLEEIYDYFYIRLCYSTGQINDFKLTYVGGVEGSGFVLSIPSLEDPSTTHDYVERERLSDAFVDLETILTSWGVEHASDINRIVSNAKTTDLIVNSEAYYDTQLHRVADDIFMHKDVRLVLIAGPSSSGKTTTAKKLTAYLKSRGKGVLQISTDDYFVNKVDTPKAPDGSYDFESLYAVDLKLFNDHLRRLMAGEEVERPTYNFVTGKREYNKDFIKLEDNDIMVIEGIHSLNSELTNKIDAKYKYHIYISPLIPLNIDNHSHIHTTDVRKLRRIVRDSRTRGRGALDTLNMWSSIRKGEERNIYPYQHRADFVINSTLIYEIGVLKTYAEPLLFCVKEDDEVYPEALRLINFLRNFVAIPSDAVPIDSVLREFIGGSCFEN